MRKEWCITYTKLVGVSADDFTDLFTVLVQQEGGHGLDSYFSGDFLLRVDVALEELDVVELVREFVKDGSDHFATSGDERVSRSLGTS